MNNANKGRSWIVDDIFVAMVIYGFLILRHNKTDNLFTDDLYLHIPYT